MIYTKLNYKINSYRHFIYIYIYINMTRTGSYNSLTTHTYLCEGNGMESHAVMRLNIGLNKESENV